VRGASVADAAQIRFQPTEPATSAPSGTHGNGRRANPKRKQDKALHPKSTGHRPTTTSTVSGCTLTTIGHDNTGELVGFTAAQCGGPGSQVLAEGTDGTVGTVAAANGNLHYAVIKFDPAKVTPISDFAGFAISGIGPDPGSSQPVCTHGVGKVVN